MKKCNLLVKKILSLILAIVISFSTISGSFYVKSYAIAFPSTFPVGQVLWELFQCCMNAGAYLSTYSGDIADAFEKGFNNTAEGATIIGVEKAIQMLAAYSYSYKNLSAEERSAVESALRENYSGGISKSDLSSASGTTSKVSTQLWSDLKSDYYSSMKNDSTSAYNLNGDSVWGLPKSFESHYRFNSDGTLDFKFQSSFKSTLSNSCTVTFSDDLHVRNKINKILVIVADGNTSTTQGLDKKRKYYLYYLQVYGGQLISSQYNSQYYYIKSDNYDSQTKVSSSNTNEQRSYYFTAGETYTASGIPVMSISQLNSLIDSVNNGVEYSGVGKVTVKDVVDADAMSKVLQGMDYVTYDQLQDIITKCQPNNYETVNEYVTDARQYVNNYYYTTEEGDTYETHNHITNIESTYDDSSMKGFLGNWFGEVISKIGDQYSIIDAIKLLILGISADIKNITDKVLMWDFADWFEQVFEFYERVKVAIDNWEQWREDTATWTFADWFKELFEILYGWRFGDWFDGISTKLGEWSFADWWSDLLDKLGEWTFADWWNELLEKIRSWDFAEWFKQLIEGVNAIPGVLSKALVGVEVGELDIVGSLTEFFTIDTTAISVAISTASSPIDFNGFKGFINPFTTRYSNVTYPVFTMNTPDILQKFYPQSVIVLYDTNDHKDIFSKVRMIMTFCLYFGMCMWIVKFFKGQFIGGKGGE